MSISSSSSEFSPDLSYFAVKCKICSKTGHGLHFGLETCRACAAFFRRTVVLNRKYKCRKRVGHCEILLEDDQNSKSPCKFCRFKKCLDMGMTSEKVDSPSTSSALSEREEQIAYNIAHPKTRGPAILLDINAIIKKSRTILETYYLPDEDSISHSNLFNEWSTQFKNYDPDKIGIQNSEKKLNSSKYSNIQNSLGSVAAIREVHYDCKDLCVFGGKMIQYYEIIVKPFLDLKLSETEITFILCQIVWNYAGRRLQGQTQAAGERFLEEISNNLHSYYEENSGSSGRIFGDSENPGNPQNYASRLARMMQIVNQMLNVQLHLENTINIAFLFDMFNIVFTEPEFFRC
ncbi:Protein CBG20727 [Caenorhabditis briggsae]|uniref:Protein CBG20727 n=1 Tax=Caenorhabditis briggsae TaxID=6238 RepID=A8XYG9_CAEBR|nr:Protein CBG20727 [Caenorhabditis briggsae]CAP37686.2 Protein CBG20727 [Caenorhabditis briggsae]